MKRKYLTAFIMISVMGMGMCGCGSAGTEPKPPEKEETVTEEGGGDMDATTRMETEDASKEKQEVSAAPRLEVERTYYDSGEDYEYFYGSYDMASVVNEGYPELKQAVGDWFQELKKSYEAEAVQYIKDARDAMESEYYDMGQFCMESAATVTRSDSRITSLVMDEYSYLGGAHGSSYMYGVTFDSSTGKEIAFEDLGDVKGDVMSYVTSYVEKKRQEGYSYDFFEDNVDSVMESPAWYLNGLGLNIIFNEYAIASYAEGRTVVTIPYGELPGLKDAFCMEGEEMYVELPINEERQIDVDVDGEGETLCLIGDYDGNGDMNLSLKLDALRLDIGFCSRIAKAYYVRTGNGRSFVLVSYDMMSDDYATDLIEITSGTPEKKDNVGFGRLASVSCDLTGMDCLLYVLGTYRAKMNYHFSDGNFVADEERFTLLHGENWNAEMIPVTKTAVPVKMEKDGELVEQELPAGTKIYPINTDNASVLGFKLEDGTYGELYFERKDGMIYIGDMGEFDCFDDMPYVG